MSNNEPPLPPPPPGGDNPPDYGQPPPSYGGYGQPPAPGAYGGAPAPHPGGGQPATLGPRFLARLIDGVLFFVVSLVIGAIIGAILISTDSSVVNLDTGEVDQSGTFAASLVSNLLSTAIVLAYYAFLESSRGQTVGKMVMKLKVVTPEGGNPTLVQALKRNIWLAASILSVLGLLGSALSSLVSLGAVILIVIGISGDTARRQSFFDKFGGDLQVLKVG